MKTDHRSTTLDVVPRLARPREAYDLWAATYDDLDNPLVAMSSLARESLRPTLAGSRVLELGCGTGRNRAFFLEAGAREYVGVDESEGMLERARSLPEDPRTRWLAADIGSPLPRDLQGFDLVVFCLVLEHVAELAPVFRHCASATRAGGRLQLYELHAELHEEGTRAHFRAGGQEHHVASYAHDAAEYRRALAESGWETARITDWLATTESCRVSAKLARHLGKAVLIDVAARRV